jgi:hypothetical protein
LRPQVAEHALSSAIRAVMPMSARVYELSPGPLPVGAASTIDGICDLLGGPGGREVCGVDDLGLIVQPGASRLSVGL